MRDPARGVGSDPAAPARPKAASTNAVFRSKVRRGSTSREGLVDRLRDISGNRHVLTSGAATRRYTRGFRFGGGPALAVVRPGSLIELWRMLEACVAADAIVIMQAANTGLTGGSTPDGADYDRPVVLVNAMRIDGIRAIRGGRQVVCLPGATLDRLERLLAALGREPHSVIGSSCFGASVVGGICNNSGGSLVRRGPAFTEMALFARLTSDGHLELVNRLDMRLGDDAEDVLDRVERGEYGEADIGEGARGSDHDYERQVRDVDADTPARYNADPRCLHDASGCAGHLAVFAVRLDTFPTENGTRVYCIGSNRPECFARLRREVLLSFRSLPIACEYMHREAFDIAARYGKDMFLLIERLGTARLPRLFAAKARFDDWAERVPGLPADLSDRLLQALAGLFPQHLPRRLLGLRGRNEHMLLLKVGEDDAQDAETFLRGFFAEEEGEWFACDADESRKAFLHRFVIAGAANRVRAVRPRDVEDIVALDLALRRNDPCWFEQRPAELESAIVHRLYYGHFLCHVLHQDYVIAKGNDCEAFKNAICAMLNSRGARYPAEHNVGHLYQAEPQLAAFYRRLDPCNAFNPGCGRLPRTADWAEGARVQ